MRNIDDLCVYAYILDEEDDSIPVLLHRLKSVKGYIWWAIRRGGYCMNHDGKWEYEPMPSSRDDEFFKRCRFGELSEAYDTYKKSIGE